ncbi:MAG: hypothetical protein H0U10_02365 [Chloroflexia bacterium]|nr:hypothetical protein [Chloroflexia bacterium]
MERLLTAVVLLGSVLLLAACGGPDTAVSGRAITVTGSALILDPSNFSRSGSSCTGAGAFSTVREGASITVDGDTTATLSSGSITEEGNRRLLFEVDIPDKDVPKRYDFRVEGMPSVIGIVNTQTPNYWQSPDADGWVTLGWDS